MGRVVPGDKGVAMVSKIGGGRWWVGEEFELALFPGGESVVFMSRDDDRRYLVPSRGFVCDPSWLG